MLSWATGVCERRGREGLAVATLFLQFHQWRIAAFAVRAQVRVLAAFAPLIYVDDLRYSLYRCCRTGFLRLVRLKTEIIYRY